MAEERSFWLGFSFFPGIGPGRFKKLLERFGSAESAWSAPEETLQDTIGEALTRKFSAFRKNNDVTIFEETVEENNGTFLTWNDVEYPQLLRQVTNAPFVLYCKGKIDAESLKELLGENTIAIVGTRKITAYGREVTTRITESLVSAGYTIVSGLAFGVDAVAHGVTVANRGKTVAVLGCGIECPSPREHAGLYHTIIASGGAIVSEYPLSEPPTKGSFPSRNRIIAGLSQAVIVTEGSADSGALYTADDAFALNRPVFAVPGPITSSLSKGPHSLIEKGAHLISSVDDILQTLGRKSIKSIIHIKGDTEEEQKIIALLQNEGLLFDEMAKRLQVDPSALGVLLSLMEMKGMIKNSDGGVYTLTS
jgi:DNA processing protein